MNNNKLLTLCFVYLLCSISKAHAYLDPGTGSIILQAILGLLAAGAATISLYWEKFKSIINKIFKRDAKNNKNNIKL
jgi:uncharacterized membrane protein